MHFCDEFFVFTGGFLFLFVGDLLFLLGAEVDVALGDRLELLFVVFAETGQDELVHGLDHKQHLDVFLFEYLEVGRVLDGAARGAGDVVDFLLVDDNALGIFLERHVFPWLGFAAFEQEQILDFILVRGIDLDAFLEHLAELAVKTEVIIPRLFHHRLECGEDFTRDVFLDFFDDGIFLQDFAGDVQWQIVGLDDTLGEAQVAGEQRFAVVHDEDAFHVQVDAVLGAFLLEHVERRLGG